MREQEQETQEFASPCCCATCQSFMGYGLGLILGVPSLILASLGRNMTDCTHRSPLLQVGEMVYLGELFLVLLLILGSIFLAKTVRPFAFALGLGLLTMIVPLFLTAYGAFSDTFLQCSKWSLV